MIKTTIKNYDVIEVTAKFESRVLQERRLRFYMQDALAFAKESFPDETFLEPLPGQIPVISNYSEPLQTIWLFQIYLQPEENFKDMADNFEKIQLKSEERSDTLDVKISSKKRKEKEI